VIDEEGPAPGTELRARDVVAALVRRIRRVADLSQRDLAGALGVAASTVARAESGARDLPAAVLARAAELAGLRLALLDATGVEAPGMDPGAVTDRAGRHFPAHLDTRHGDEDWWHGSERYSRERPWYTFDRDRHTRDHFRGGRGAPADHQSPQPGDGPEARARAREDAARAARAAESRRRTEELRRRGGQDVWAPTCTCPADCDELLFPTTPLTPSQNAVPHVEDCACRCDIA
jgi:transcriptional regulator with XRE-family HTH domain